MRYKPRRLARIYLRETFSSPLRLPAALGSLLRRCLHAVVLWWSESFQYRYVRYRAEDISRTVQHVRRSPQLTLSICLCASMSLGFIVTHSPADETPSYFIKVNLSRPQITALKDDETPTILTAKDISYLQQQGLIEQSDWFASRPVEPLAELAAATSNAPLPGKGQWRSSSGLFSINGNQASLNTVLGEQRLQRFGQLNLCAASTPLPLNGLTPIAAGYASPESLLADISSQSVKVLPAQAEPQWGRGKYGTEVFSGPLLHWTGAALPQTAVSTQQAASCRLDRMETASWLNLLRLENSANKFSARQASQYRDYVEHFAGHYSLSPSLVLAIMRVESNFNPMVVSSANALGLMQVVPQTAGGEVHAFLTGKKGIPRPELLFKPEQNIQYGTTYLHLLNEKHFKDVKNPLSREMCVIAAYNCGPNQVLRVFSRDRKRAFELINALTPEQLYARLVKNLPHQETRDYLPKVLSARSDFARGAVKF